MTAKQENTGQPAPSDADLMHRLANGDMDALGALVERHQHRVRSLAYRMTGRWDAADDIAQEAFLRLHRIAGSYRPTAAFSTWLYRIVVNLCLDHAKRRKPVHLPDDPGSAGSAPPADDDLARRERVAAIQQAIASLPERQRAVLVLHRFESLSHEQIEAVTGWSTSAVESLLVRAYAKLREQLKGWADR